MTEWKTIRVPAGVYEDAKARKEEHGVTWGQYVNPHAWHSVFDERRDEPLSESLEVECSDGVDTQALVDDLVTQLPPRIAEEMEGRMR